MSFPKTCRRRSIAPSSSSSSSYCVGWEIVVGVVVACLTAVASADIQLNSFDLNDLQRRPSEQLKRDEAVMKSINPLETAAVRTFAAVCNSLHILFSQYYE